MEPQLLNVGLFPVAPGSQEAKWPHAQVAGGWQDGSQARPSSRGGREAVLVATSKLALAFALLAHKLCPL